MECFESADKIILIPDAHDNKLPSGRPPRSLYSLHLAFGLPVRVDQRSDSFGVGDKLAQNLQYVGVKLAAQCSYPSNVGSWLIEAGPQTQSHRVGQGGKNNRDC